MRYINRLLLKTCCILLISFFSNSAISQQFESIEKIKSLAKNFIEKNITLEENQTLEVHINSSDIPARLTICSKDIEVAFPREANREKMSAVELICNGDKSWHSYVPVSVQKYAKVLAAKHFIPANQSISEYDLDYVQANVNRLFGGYFKEPVEVVGQVASSAINAGTIISRKSIHFPQLVHKNQEVELIARKNSIQVTMKGIAKTDGSLNDTIVAYNPSSKKTLEAVVIGLNKAEVIS